MATIVKVAAFIAFIRVFEGSYTSLAKKWQLVIAIIIAIAVMMFAARTIGDFVDRHPTVKMLALSFLILVGVVLIVDSTHRHIPKGYIYFSMAFSIGVEMLNLRLRRGKAIKLHVPRSE